MPKTAVVTDSSACLPPELADRLGIAVVPITIHLPDGDLADGMPEAPSAVYSALRAGAAAKSSAPTPAEYLAAVEDRGADGVLIVTPATEFTGMSRSAAVAAKVAGRRVAVLDSRTAAAAQGLVVLSAAQAAAEGAGFDEVLRVGESAVRRAELVAALDGLDHITRSGRVPPMALGLARRLGVRPVFRFSGGQAVRVGVPRSEEASFRRIRAEWAGRGGPGAERTAVFHAAASGRGERLAAVLETDAVRMEFGPSMGIHTGPGLVGVAWLRAG